jgi:hypothetical protein
MMLYNDKDVIEGYIIAYGPYLWVVKGCEHPKGFFIAYPRYSRSDGLKVKDPSLGVSIARRLGLARYFDCLMIEVPLVPRDKVEFVLDPFDRDQWPQLPGNVVSFFNALNVMGSRYVGLAGSYLVSRILLVKPRDLDLLIKGEDCGLRIYNRLVDMRVKGLTKPYIEGEDFNGTDPRTRNALLRYRVLEGVFNDLVYSIRVTSCLGNEEPKCISKVEYYTGEVLITKALSPFTMPYTYSAMLKDYGELFMKSQRMRFSEIPEGVRLFVRNCRIEYYEDGKVYLSLDNPECIVSILT